MKERILIKLSGEALMGQSGYGIDVSTINFISKEIKKIANLNYEICLIIGGGNIFRGVKGASEGIDRSTSDYMGMLATIMNALSLQSCLEQINLPTRVQSAISMSQIAEPYIKRKAVRHLEKNRIVIFAAGTGNPFFTTDSAACVRGIEIDADMVLKATRVDGVYSADPLKDPTAVKYEALSYDEVLEKQLGVMDLTAICLARDHQMPLRVFAMEESGALRNAVILGEGGTLVSQTSEANRKFE